jgi:hypothetical protein
LKPFTRLNNKAFLILLGSVVVGFVIDTSLARIYSVTFGYSSSVVTLILFFVMLCLFILSQALILKFVKSKLGKYRINTLTLADSANTIFKIVLGIQCLLSALLFVLLFQVLIVSEYSLLLLKTLILISYSTATILIGFLVLVFVFWLRKQRSDVIILYACSIATLCLSTLFTGLYMNELLSIYPDNIRPRYTEYLPYLDPQNPLNTAFQIFSLIPFVTMWIVTVVLFRGHSKRFSRIRYLVTLSLPLVYFLIQFYPIHLQLFVSQRLSDPVFFGIAYSLFFNPSNAVGGAIFGLAFWSIGRKVGNQRIKDYMNISGFGILLFFTSNQAIVLITAPFPPFGLVTISFIGLSAYLLLVGIYSAAISVAQDIELRKTIRRSLEHQSAFLEKIGTSEMERQVEKRVVNLTSKVSEDMERNSGIEGSIEPDDIKDYVNQVMREIKGKEERST